MRLNLVGGALRHCFRLYEWLRAFYPGVRSRDDIRSGVVHDGLPLPPAALRMRVAGTADIGCFLEGGRLGAQSVRNLLAAGGLPIERCSAILDFGCGCGRVLRHLKDLTGTAVCGTDLREEAIHWCREHLPFTSVSVNSLEPPLSFADQQFDAVYAFSVLTHMPAGIQTRWLQEFRRILRRGGLLVFSTHGSYYLPGLSKRERRRFVDGELVVRFGSAAGSNLCSVFHPEQFVRDELARWWEIAAFVPEGALGNPRQDGWVFRRP